MMEIIFDKILWIIITALLGGIVGLIFWRYQRHKEHREEKERLRVTFKVFWTGKKSEFVINVKVINTSLVPVTIESIDYSIKRSGKYARTIKDPGFRDPFDTLEALKHNLSLFLKHKIAKYFGFNDHFTFLQFSKDEKILQKYGDQWVGNISESDHTIHNTDKIKISVYAITSTGSKFKGIREN